MSSKIWKRITENIGLKIISIFFAVALWLVVVNVEDPEMTSTFTVSVDVINENYLTNNNKVYEIMDNTDTIRVSVTAKRSIIKELANSDFLAVADLSQADLIDGASVQQIPIEVNARRYSGRLSISVRNYYLKVEVDDNSSAEIPVKANYLGTTAEGFTVGTLTTTPSTIVVTGPATLIDQVAYALVEVDVSGAIDDFATRLTPVLCDEEGNRIVSEYLSMDVNDITVYAEILQLKTLPIVYSTTGTPKDGYAVDQVTADVNSIIVKGSADTLSAINELHIDDIDVTGLGEEQEFEVNLREHLPAGVRLYINTDVAKVKVSFKETTTLTYTMATSAIEVSGLAETQRATVAGSFISFNAAGAPEVMEELQNSDFIAELDLSSYTKAGNYTVEVKITAPDKVLVTSRVYVNVAILGDAPDTSGDATDTTETVEE